MKVMGHSLIMFDKKEGPRESKIMFFSKKLKCTCPLLLIKEGRVLGQSQGVSLLDILLAIIVQVTSLYQVLG